ncbi:DNA internalization-related competence protein ComEC/Rec2 [Desulfovibrio sulfodismutans]|uniref:DNA internalization-related competence protein ComEC/Rec2 n=1 Tax=Desulfolutivibrio sulfodismutans TaxID=63561 RepID=A0A7K3NSB9_9BACT|nr:DNA internalization-related competence protein ComEC/Rec2 [Desulfolutivibrio sulfodismutans]NDY58109.1 DNA internalization-related competence protein ComEC/Rec2 [Desulfolutivibrio sulfodismutans]
MGHTQTPLLPWQILFVCAVCGILALRVPQAAVAALSATVLLALATRTGKGVLALAPLAFGLGLGMAALALPDPPARTPRDVLTGTRTVVVGTAASVTPLPGDRLSVVLDDPRLTTPTAKADPKDAHVARRPVPLPGRLLLTWDNPAWRPSPGDVLALAARVRPVTSFRNPGGFDTVFARRLEDVFFRIYARGDQPILLTASDSPWREVRQNVRRAILDAVTPPPADAPGAIAESGQGNAPGRTTGQARADRTPEKAVADEAGLSGTGRAADAPHDQDASVTPPTPGGAMLLALLTGDTSALTGTDMDLVRRASLAHALALSGMHVGYVAAMVWLAIRLIGRLRPAIYLRLPRQKLVVLLAAPLVAGYVWLGGFSPSLVRAALMFGCFGALILLDRPRVMLDGLFLALAIIVAVSPLSVFDIRLQLSALAVAGLGVFWPLGQAIFDRLPLPEISRPAALWIFGILWTSLSAEAAILPILALEFGELSPHVYLNLLWLPVLGFVVMPLGLAGLLTSFLSPDAAAVFYVPAAWVCDWLMGLLAWQDGLGFLDAAAVLRPLWPEIVGYFLLCSALAVWWRKRPDGRLPGMVLAVGLALLAAPGVRQAWRDLSGEVRLTMIDVGQGQALVAEVTGGRRILVDGGGTGFGNFDMGRAVTGPALAYGRSPELAGMILTHGHTDHAQGLIWPLSRFDVGFFAESASPDAGAPDAALTRAVAASGLAPRPLAAGDRLDLGNGAALEVLHPPAGFTGKANDASVVLRLVKNGRGLALLCGDIEKKAIRMLVASGRDMSAEVLVLPHHGSATSVSRAFYKAVNPRAAFISCGPGNRFRYPADKALAELARRGCPVYVTAALGAVTATWDGDEPADITSVVAAGQPPRELATLRPPR